MISKRTSRGFENRLGQNLKQLRNNRGETLQEIATFLNCCSTTLKNYESGVRQPDPVMLQRLAKYFGITINELVYSDFPELEPKEFSIKSSSEIVEMQKILYPVSYSDKALENPDFKTGYDYCCRILNATEHNEILRGSILNDCYDFFEKAAEVTDIDGKIVIPEAVANMVWAIFQMWTYIGSEYIPEVFHTPIFPITKNSVCKMGSDLWNEMSENEKIIEERKKFKEYYDDKLVELIATLKSDSEWAELGDYYLAQRYSRLIINNARSSEENEVVGVEIMSTLLELGNQYAQNYVKTFWKLDVDKFP